MPGTTQPLRGFQAFAAAFQNLTTRVVNLEVWQRSATGIIAPGVITQWGGAAPPPGALACDGSTFSAITYPRLAAALGSTTLPNLPGTPIYVIWT
jgi:hypothetical protein